MVRNTTELHQVLVSMDGLGAETGATGTARVRPGCRGDTAVGRTLTDTGAIPGTRSAHGRYTSAFSIGLAMGLAPGVVAGWVGFGQGGGNR